LKSHFWLQTMPNSTEYHRERGRRYYLENKDAIDAAHREYYQNNKDKIRAKQRARYAENLEKERERGRRFYEANKEAKKAYAEETKDERAARMRKYRGMIFSFGQTVETMFAAQNGICEACLVELPQKGFATDHDHHAAPGVPNVRGLLHKTCNSALGKLGEKYGNEVLAANLRRAANYIERDAGVIDYVWEL
jgi:hypothetical protein